MPASGKLVVCPTPLGNLGDMTARALEALRAADVVCAEDTRVTGRLLAAYGIEKRLERLDEALIGERASVLVERVAAGEVIAYCSDAGMPGVSDPGLRLVRAAREAGAPVEVLPGPTAAATAYVASGCDNPRFYFGGFFPRKDAERRTALAPLRALDAALIFYESPNRLASALEVLADELPHREAAVCRELTKLHEEVVRGPLPEVRDEFAARAAAGGRGIKGEIVIVVDGPSAAEGAAAEHHAEVSARARAAELKAQGMRNKDIARAVAEEFGIARNVAYGIALEA
ncbi:16S rRNA (cytidine(1402)-2'-O)-methyltransferase [Arabiibacter massiliensis]|uniref:16S rRNA (cytidine(1402)-2'-O)-methyltransferase n=1 Tax=Arabiibacter massiliensis TaxID=1870985 RepID=UPI0009B9B876|nr:16S rRNA (cytidine(1402)-2'-O)-methyltransferase [Arabiibacter massiliensis]